MPPRVAIIVKGYPRLSETFIAQEMLALQERGLGFEIVSLRHPTDRAVHGLNRQIRAPVRYLPEYLYREPLRVLRGWWRARRLPGYRGARRLWLRDLRRDPTPNRGRRFGQALALAAELPASVGHLHVHYLHTPASVARYAAALTGLPWSCSAHAKDIWTTPDWEKREKLRDLRWLVTCTALGAAHLRGLAPGADVELVYHGLDPGRFPAPDRRPGSDGSDPARPVRLLCVARAVPKKGLDVALDALARLPAGLHWRFVHIGGGQLIGGLRTRAERLGLADRVEWRGARTEDGVLAAYREADLFVLASRIAPDGDRDGLPNVLLEALSQELAAVASRAAAVPELIEHGRTGRLVPPDDPEALAAALAGLIADPGMRLRLGRAGRRRVLESFAFGRGIDRLAARFDHPPGRAGTEAA
ncbi:MAG TPA: glycosyltransferase [Geminicoccaceae bacterium]|nr:glycosyltransferase [Geminicoccaceae bacterium]